MHVLRTCMQLGHFMRIVMSHSMVPAIPITFLHAHLLEQLGRVVKCFIYHLPVN